MSFLSPVFLFGLPLLAVPLVIHLLSRRQQKRISWGAMQFLVQAATRKRRLWRLTDLLLLLLRTAALLFFIFALTRPLLPATWLGGTVPRDIILVLDPSMSMSRRANGSSLFELQLQQAGAMLDQLKGSDTIRILLAGQSPEWLSPDPLPATVGMRRQLRERLGELRPTLGSADLVASLREVADLEAPKDKSTRIIYVMSDGQRHGWRLDERPLWEAMQARVEQSSIPTVINLHLLPSPEPEGNLSVNGLEAPRAFGAIGQSLSFTAAIQNNGVQPSAPSLLTWRVNDQSIGVSTVPELAPGAGTTLSVSHTFEAAGPFEVSCQLEINDVLSADNQGQFQVLVYERLPVLLVGASGDSEDLPFLLAALGASGDGRAPASWRSVFEPSTVIPGELAATDLAQFRAVILSNVRAVPLDALQKLEAYVQNGGGLWLALGQQTDETFFNERFYRGGLGLAPLKLTSPLGDPNDHETFVSVRTTSDAHPATALLGDFQRLDLDRVRIYRRHQFDPFSGKDVSILLQAPGGEPIAVERKLGRGRVLVQGIPLGISWSTLPICQVYVALLHEWLWYLSEPNLPKRNLEVGEALMEEAPTKTTAAQLFLPNGKAVELSTSGQERAPQFRYLGTRWPGSYSLVPEDDSDHAAPVKFNVQRDPRESDLTTLSESDRHTMAVMKAFKLSQGLDDVANLGQVEIPKHPLEGWLLTALAAVLLGELALAGWTTHQRRLRVKPVTM